MLVELGRGGGKVVGVVNEFSTSSSKSLMQEAFQGNAVLC